MAEQKAEQKAEEYEVARFREKYDTLLNALNALTAKFNAKRPEETETSS